MHINKHHSIHVFSIRSHSTFNTYPVNTYPTIAYPVNTYPRNTQDHTYPFNAYPFKRYASSGMAMYVNAKHTSIRIHPIRKTIRIPSMRVLSMGLRWSAYSDRALQVRVALVCVFLLCFAIQGCAGLRILIASCNSGLRLSAYVFCVLQHENTNTKPQTQKRTL